MAKQEAILAFLLSDSGQETQYDHLHKWLLQSCEVLKADGTAPFDFISAGGSLVSFELNNILAKFEKKGLISQNGHIRVEDSEAMMELGRKLDLTLQLKIRAEVKQDKPINNLYVFNLEWTPTVDTGYIYTTGYEGKTLDAFLISLLESGIKTLIDVRCNAVSRKFGFSKKQLGQACQVAGLDYVHMPELGIPSESRQSLKTQQDYDSLFYSYKVDILPVRQKEKKLVSEMSDANPCALMCYEANPMQCHRTCLAQDIADSCGKKIKNIGG